MNAGWVFRLYIAGGAPTSVRALANLYTVCRENFPDCHRIEVIDVEVEPLRALEAGVMVAPMLEKVSPGPALRIIGDLSDENAMLHAIGLPGKGST